MLCLLYIIPQSELENENSKKRVEDKLEAFPNCIKRPASENGRGEREIFQKTS